MNRILEIADDATWVRVQPGVVMGSLNRELRARGVFFAPDPSSENYCSLGGMIGTNSSGARTVAYGGTKDHVLAVETVVADGSLFRAEALPADSPALSALLAGDSLGARAFAHVLRRLETQSALIAARMPNVVKNCSGYRVEAIVARRRHAPAAPVRGGRGHPGSGDRSHAQPGSPARSSGVSPWPTSRPSSRRARRCRASLAWGPTAIEIMDSRFLAVVRKNDARVDAMLPPQTDTALLIEFEGRDEAELEDRFAALSRHLAQTGVLQVVRPRDAEETERLWTVRKSAVALALRLPGTATGAALHRGRDRSSDRGCWLCQLPAGPFRGGGGGRLHVRPRGRRQHPHSPPARPQRPGRPSYHGAALRGGVRVRLEHKRHDVRRAR